MPDKDYLKEYGDIQRDFGTLFQVVKDVQETLKRIESSEKAFMRETKVTYATKRELIIVHDIALDTKNTIDKELPAIKEELRRASSIFGIGSKIGKFFVFVTQVALTSFVTLIVAYYWAHIV